MGGFLSLAIFECVCAGALICSSPGSPNVIGEGGERVWDPGLGVFFGKKKGFIYERELGAR